MVYTDAGEDLVVSCPECGYAANLEKATSRAGAGGGAGSDGRWKAGAGAHAGQRSDRGRRRVSEGVAEARHQDGGVHGDVRRADPTRQASSEGRGRWPCSCAAITRSARPSCSACDRRQRCARRGEAGENAAVTNCVPWQPMKSSSIFGAGGFIGRWADGSPSRR